MEFSDESAIVSCFRKRARDERIGIGKEIVPVAVRVDSTRVHPGEETGATRRAYRALAVGVRKGDTFRYEAIDVRRCDVRIAERADGIVTLLICAEPEDVWRVSSHKLFKKLRHRARESFNDIFAGERVVALEQGDVHLRTVYRYRFRGRFDNPDELGASGQVAERLFNDAR